MTDLTNNLASLKLYLNELENELTNLKNGRKVASGKSRKILQNIKTTSHTMRKQIVDYVKTLPIKKKPIPMAVPEPIVEPVPEPIVEVVQSKKKKKKVSTKK